MFIVSPLSLNLCFYKNLVQCTDGVFEVIVSYTDNDIQLAGSLVDHLDIDMGMGKGGENSSGSAACGTHSSSDDSDQSKIRLQFNVVRIHSFMDFQPVPAVFLFELIFMSKNCHCIDAGRHMLDGNTVLSNSSSTLRQNPISEFIIAFSMVTAANPSVPAIPVMVYFGCLQVLSTISVPLSCGALVLRILIGMPTLRTGKIASS